jgi:hypothetical protein
VTTLYCQVYLLSGHSPMAQENATLKSSCERKMATLKKILTDLYKVATEEHLRVFLLA